MTEPRWVADSLVHLIHNEQLAEHGGQPGIRDEGMLLSALHRPTNLYAYNPDSTGLCDLAAAYAFGIAKNHLFLDGNKRTAAVVCELFLALNGLTVDCTEVEKYPHYIGLAAGEHSEAAFAMWLESCVTPREE